MMGAFDFFVELFEHFGDELIVARLVECIGCFMGELVELLLIVDGCVLLVVRFVVDYDVDLVDCYVYGDSLVDLLLFELVGYLYAINLDFWLLCEVWCCWWLVEIWMIVVKVVV